MTTPYTVADLKSLEQLFAACPDPLVVRAEGLLLARELRRLVEAGEVTSASAEPPQLRLLRGSA